MDPGRAVVRRKTLTGVFAAEDIPTAKAPHRFIFHDLFCYVEPLCSAKDRKTVLAVALSRYGYFYLEDS